MNHTPRRTKLWTGAVVAIVVAGGFTGISQALLGPRADDNLRPAEVSGPCDEAEHAADPACVGTTTTTAVTGSSTTAAPTTTSSTLAPTTSTTAGAVGAAREVSGPCDEAEHAADPRCTGAVGARVDDRSSDDPSDDDSSGRGRGRGGDDGTGEDSSGHGGSDDSGSHRSGDDG